MFRCFVLLLKSSHAQHVDFLLGEEAPVAAAQVLLCESGKLHAVELDHTVAEAFEDTAHDTLWRLRVPLRRRA